MMKNQRWGCWELPHCLAHTVSNPYANTQASMPGTNPSPRPLAPHSGGQCYPKKSKLASDSICSSRQHEAAIHGSQENASWWFSGASSNTLAAPKGDEV